MLQWLKISFVGLKEHNEEQMMLAFVCKRDEGEVMQEITEE